MDSRVSTWHWFWEILGLGRITDKAIGCDVDPGLDYLISIKMGKSHEQRMQRIRIHDLDHPTIKRKRPSIDGCVDEDIQVKRPFSWV